MGGTAGNIPPSLLCEGREKILKRSTRIPSGEEATKIGRNGGGRSENKELGGGVVEGSLRFSAEAIGLGELEIASDEEVAKGIILELSNISDEVRRGLIGEEDGIVVREMPAKAEHGAG